MCSIKNPHFSISLFFLSVITPFLFFCHLSLGQTPKLDSLKKALPLVKDDTSRANTLNGISRELFLSGKYDSSLVCAENAKSLSEKAAFAKGISNAYNNIGNVHLNKGNRDEALKNYDDALKALSGMPKNNEIKKLLGNAYSNIGSIHITTGNYEEALKNFNISFRLRTEADDKKGIAICYTNIGVIHYYQGNYPEALKNYLAALKLDKERGDKNAIARGYNNSGNIYVQQANYSDALKNYSAALSIQKEIGDKQGIGRCHNNIGAVYFFQKNYASALDAFVKGLEIKEEIGDQYGIGHAHINIGNVLYSQGLVKNHTEAARKEKMGKALPEFFTALEVLSATGDKQGMAMCYNNIGTVYVMLNKGNEALIQLKKGLKLSKETGSKEDIKASYKGLASADSLLGNWKEAYNHQQQYTLYKDSLLNEENTKKLVQSQMNFDFEQKEIKSKAEQDQKEALYQEEIKQQRIIGWGIAGIFIFLLMFSILLFNRYRLKQKQAFQKKLIQQQKEQAIAIMETQEQERKRIAEDLHDSLGHLLSTVKLNLQTLPDDQRHHYVNSLQLLNQASKEIHDISFNLMPQTLEEEGLIPALHELTEKIRKSSLYDIILQVHDMENFEIDKQTKFNIYRIVQEAVSNILKHADAKEINIQLVKQENQLTIMIEDDGKGFDANQIKKNGRGLRNITARAEWLLGTIQIDSTPGRGTTISIEIPIGQKDGY